MDAGRSRDDDVDMVVHAEPARRRWPTCRRDRSIRRRRRGKSPRSGRPCRQTRLLRFQRSRAVRLQRSAAQPCSRRSPTTPSCPTGRPTCRISPAGSVEWLCVPRPDSPSVFGAILDRSAGHFRIGPYGVSVPSARRYLPGSLIMETTWQTHTGWVIVRDALVEVARHRAPLPNTSPHSDGLGCRTHHAADGALRERHG